MKKFAKVIALLLVASLSLGMVACSNSSSSRKNKKDKKKKDKTKVTEYSCDDFEDIIDELSDGDYYITDAYDDQVYIRCEYGDASITYTFYDDEDDAADSFEEYYDNFEDDFDDDIFDGKYDLKWDGNQGYVVFDGEGTDDGTAFLEDEYYYGGVYYADGMVVVIYTSRDKNQAREDVDDVLNELKFPKP